MGEVRFSPPITILTIVAGAMGYLAIDRPPEPRVQESCEVLAEFGAIERFKPDVFGGPPLSNAMTLSDLAEDKKYFQEPAVSTEIQTLVRRHITERPIDPLIACPDLIARLTSLNISSNRQAVRDALDYKMAKRNSPHRPVYVLAMRLPLISPKGNTAIVEMTYSSAIYQSGELVIMRKNERGRWIATEMGRSWLT